MLPRGLGRICMLPAATLLIGHATELVIYIVAGGGMNYGRKKNLGLVVDTEQGRAPRISRCLGIVERVIPAAAIVLLFALIGGLRSGMTLGHKVAIMTACSLRRHPLRLAPLVRRLQPRSPGVRQWCRRS